MQTKQSKYYKNLRPLLKNKNVKTYSHIVFSLITILILSLFAIKPTIESIIALDANLKLQRTNLEKLILVSTNIKNGVASYNKIEESTKISLYTLLPNTTSVPCLIDLLNNVASKNGTKVTGLQVQPASLTGLSKCSVTTEDLTTYKTMNNTTIQEVKFTFNIQGSYDKLVNVLEDLNKSNRLINIEQANFIKQDTDPLMLSITAKGYYYK